MFWDHHVVISVTVHVEPFRRSSQNVSEELRCVLKPPHKVVSALIRTIAGRQFGFAGNNHLHCPFHRHIHGAFW